MVEDTLPQTISLLSHTPAGLNALLRGLPEAWTFRNEGENTWSVFDVVGHLIHCERDNWMPRLKILLSSGEDRTFGPFDRVGPTREGRFESLEPLLDDFARLRSESLEELRGLELQPDDLRRRGRHPTFGVVTLSELLSTWATHDLTHLHQISRIMAHQYRDAVGPWKRNLGVLRCAGHSASA